MTKEKKLLWYFPSKEAVATLLVLDLFLTAELVLR